jgi:hypothetical protein
MNLFLLAKENAVLRRAYRAAAALVELTPYYVFQEGLADDGDLDVQPGLDGCSAGFLGPADVPAMFTADEHALPEAALRARLAQGDFGFGLKRGDALLAFSCCDLRRCQYGRFGFALQPDEAYLYNAVTVKAYRGKNLAPYLRCQLYRQLRAMGRTRFYSVSLALNSSAMKLKHKLKSKPIKLCLHVRLLRKYHRCIVLRDYEAGTPGAHPWRQTHIPLGVSTVSDTTVT